MNKQDFLAGVRVVDLSQYIPGPFATRQLADLSADVIKIESDEGDWMRIPLGQQRNGVNGAFAMMNRNKRSVVIDLSADEGKDIVKRLVSECDAVVENFRPGVMERLGLGYAALAELNPRLVMCSISGFGQTGPHCGRPGGRTATRNRCTLSTSWAPLARWTWSCWRPQAWP